jgi:hypothetical protein
MEQFILLAGTVFASSIGFALLALVLVTTIRNSHKQADSEPVQTYVVDEEKIFVPAVSEPTIRGYDTPELCRDDHLARWRQSTDEKHLH